MTTARHESGLVERRIVVPSEDAIVVKALVEAYEGVACVFGETGGDLTIAAPADRVLELDAMLSAVDELLAEVRRRRSSVHP